MNIRLVIGCLLALLFCPLVSGQQKMVSDASPRDQVLQRIDDGEASALKAESAHADNFALGRIYAQLGLWYEDVGLWSRAEADLQRAILCFAMLQRAVKTWRRRSISWEVCTYRWGSCEKAKGKSRRRCG